MGRYICGIDTGTASTKGVLVDDKLNIVAEFSVPHGMENPQPGFFEMDAEEVWWKDFCKVSKGLLAIAEKEHGIQPDQIKAVGISVLGCDLVPVDEDGKALTKAMLYGIDARAEREIEELHGIYGEKEEEIVGHTLCTSDIAPKILWLKNKAPEIHEKAYKLLTGSSYVCGKLTGNYVIDPYLAEDFMPLYQIAKYNADVKEGRYNKESDYIAVEHCRNDKVCFCRPDQLAALLPATEVAGKVTVRAAAETGFAVGTPVLCGTGDSGAEAIGSGVLSAGDMLVQLGSTCYFICLSSKEIHDNRVWPGTFILPGTWAICGGTNTAGTLTEWFRNEIFNHGKNETLPPSHSFILDFAAMADSIRDIPAGSEGLICLPYFEGERTPVNDPKARGMMLGLRLKHTKAHMYKAALEGIAMEIADHVDIMEEDGIAVKRLIVSGGGTKNPEWLKMIADCTGKEVLVPKVTIGACYGDALMAALAAGFAETPEKLAERMEIEQIIRPREENQAVYSKLREVFHKAYECNKDLMRLLEFLD